MFFDVFPPKHLYALYAGFYHLVTIILLYIKNSYFLHIQEVIDNFNRVFNNPQTLDFTGFFETFDENRQTSQVK